MFDEVRHTHHRTEQLKRDEQDKIAGPRDATRMILLKVGNSKIHGLGWEHAL